MAFLSDQGSISEEFTDSLNESLGQNSNKTKGLKGNDNLLFNKDSFGSAAFYSQNWKGNAYSGPSIAISNRKLLYGFAIIEADAAINGGTFTEDNSFFLQTAPQSIQQKEIFGTNVQATRKGVIVESEGVVFKDIILKGNTGIFPGERGGSTVPTPSLSPNESGPTPPSGVDEYTGTSKKAGSRIISGYEEFIKLRQFFLEYARQKVESKGEIFFVWINEKDDQYFIVEPLDFTMERDSRSPLTYNYTIVLKAIAPLEALILVDSEESSVSLLDEIQNVSANISAAISTFTDLANQATGFLTSISQAVDKTVLTPLQQVKFAVAAISNGLNSVLALPAILAGNAENVTNFHVAVANAKESGTINKNINQSAPKQKNTSTQLTSENKDTAEDVDASTFNGETPPLLDDEGNLSSILTPQQFTAVSEILDRLDNDPDVPLPRSYVEALKANLKELRNNINDAEGLGSEEFNTLYGRTVTQPSPDLIDPTTERLLLLGELEKVINGLDKILSNNEFFQSDAEESYAKASELYGDTASINQPDSVREVTIQLGDTLERIALREYGDALRWVDLVVLNELKAPYILNELDVPKGILRPGDSILIGVD